MQLSAIEKCALSSLILLFIAFIFFKTISNVSLSFGDKAKDTRVDNGPTVNPNPTIHNITEVEGVEKKVLANDFNFVKNTICFLYLFPD